MEFRTKIPLKQQAHNQLDYGSHILLLGSCFAENIGAKLENFKFRNTSNPFGILFHPVAIESLIQRAVNHNYYTEADLFEHAGQWHCFEAHSQLSGLSKTTVLKALNEALDQLRNGIESATHVILTFGTAWVYRYVASDAIVANCHKVPQKQFLKELLSVDQIAECLEAIITLIRSVNPKVSFICTVSPVRHLKDGMVENQRSKSHLLAGLHQLIEPRHQIYYMPSYEIQMDELRDYRFYKEDMIHPNNSAIQYIWNCFTQVWIAEKAQTTMQRVEEICKGRAHRPFHPESPQYQQFLSRLKAKEAQLQSEFPFMDFSS